MDPSLRLLLNMLAIAIGGGAVGLVVLALLCLAGWLVHAGGPKAH